MNTWPILSKAPIDEALIDIRVERSAHSTIAGIEAACDDLAAEFPSRQELHTITAQISFSPDPAGSSLAAGNEPGGIILRSADEKWVAQFRLDGFTISRLRPYGTWGELKARAAELWTKYSEVAAPTKVVRVATRFINRFHLPPNEPFENTFVTNFVIGPSLPQSVAGYLLRVVLPFEEQHAIAIVTQSLDGTSSDCILDLDTFSERPEGFAENAMWNQFDELRDVKNRLFFGSLTESALERFK